MMYQSKCRLWGVMKKELTSVCVCSDEASNQEV